VIYAKEEDDFGNGASHLTVNPHLTTLEDLDELHGLRTGYGHLVKA